MVRYNSLFKKKINVKRFIQHVFTYYLQFLILIFSAISMYFEMEPKDLAFVKQIKEKDENGKFQI